MNPFDVIETNDLPMIANSPTFVMISQPEKPGYPKREDDKLIEWSDTSQPFLAKSGDELSNAKFQREIGKLDAENRWKKGVKIGAGVGAPVLFLVTVAVTYFLTMWRVRVKEKKASGK